MTGTGQGQLCWSDRADGGSAPTGLPPDRTALTWVKFAVVLYRSGRRLPVSDSRPGCL